MHDACGVVGISLKDEYCNVATSIYFALFALQHRGQEAAGISVHDGRATRTHRGRGLSSRYSTMPRSLFCEDLWA